MSLLTSLMSRCVEEGECILWNQGTNGGGKPYAWIGGKTTNLRRAVYEDSHGQLPQGRILRMTCDNAACLNEAHMRPVTRTQMMGLLSKAGALSKPQHNAARAAAARSRPCCVMSMEKAREARAMRVAGARLVDIAQAFGIHISYASAIVRHKAWRETTQGASIFTLGASS